MCTVIEEFEPEVSAAKEARSRELIRIISAFNIAGLFRRWRMLVVGQH